MQAEQGMAVSEARGLEMGRVFVTGDTHNKFEYQKVEYLCRELETTKDDVLIILGDHGSLYYGDERDDMIKGYLDSLPISFMMIKGNHDRRPNPNSFELKDIDLPNLKGKFYIDPK